MVLIIAWALIAACSQLDITDIGIHALVSRCFGPRSVLKYFFDPFNRLFYLGLWVLILDIAQLLRSELPT